MTTPWTPPTPGVLPQQPQIPATTAEADTESNEVPEPKVNPFKCEACYEQTMHRELKDFENERHRIPPIKFLRTSRLSPTSYLLQTLYLQGAERSNDGREFSLGWLKRLPNGELRVSASTNYVTTARLQHGITDNLSVLLNLDAQSLDVFGKGYCQWKSDRFCTRVGAGIHGLRPSMYSMSHLHGLTDRLAVGAKVSALHGALNKPVAAASVRFDTGRGVVTATATTKKKIIATCTRQIAHQSTPNDYNATLSANLTVPLEDTSKTYAALGYKLKFPNSGEEVSGSISSGFTLRSSVSSNMDMSGVRCTFSTLLDFRQHNYKFGIGFVLGETIEEPRSDFNPMSGDLIRFTDPVNEE